MPDTSAPPVPPLHQPQEQQHGEDSGQLTGDTIEQLPGGITENTFSQDDFPPAQPEQLDTPTPTPTSSPTPMPTPTPPQSPAPSTETTSGRPRRERKPNSLYNPEMYDLSKAGIENRDDNLGLEGLVEDSTTLSRGQVIELFKFILARLPEDS